MITLGVAIVPTSLITHGLKQTERSGVVQSCELETDHDQAGSTDVAFASTIFQLH